MDNSQAYVSLANKYRPSNLEELKGQDHVTCIIKEQLKTKNIPSCIVFSGIHGSGKTSTSRIIAKELNNHSSGTIEIDSALDGGKEYIKLVLQDVYNCPLVGDYKTYIIEEAQGLSKQCLDSLLKTLEEPPSHVKFILTTTNFDKIPLTIKSRAQSHIFCPIQLSVIKETLREICKRENKEVSTSQIALAANSSMGSLRNAIVALELIFNSGSTTEDKLADILGIAGTNRLTNFVMSYLLKDFLEMHKLIKQFCSESLDPARVLSELQQFLMDSRVYLINPSISNDLRTDLSIFNSRLESITKKSFSDLSILERKTFGRSMDKIYDMSLNTESFINRTINKEALFTRFLIQLAASWNEK